jgi:hypothetical protein
MSPIIPAESKFTTAVLAAANAVFYATKAGLVWRYLWKIGRLPNIAHPRRYSERMLWRKIVDHNPQFVVFSDKLATKEFVRARCPELRVPRTLWIGRDADAIPEELLRGDVFVKANHGCGFNQRIGAGHCDRAALRKKTQRWMRSGYGRKGGEWAYSRVEPKLFVEEAIGDVEAGMVEFNVRAGQGKAILGSVLGKCKTPDQWAIYLDPEGTPTLGMKDPDGSPIKPLPEGLAVMEPYRRAVRFAERLSEGVDYARFDFLWNGTELYGGEITVYPAAGGADPANAVLNHVMLMGWDLRQAHFLKAQHTGWRRIYADALRRRLTLGLAQIPLAGDGRVA